MITIEQIEEALRDDYGGCRDINFENPTWDGVNNLVRWFFQYYQVRSASDYQGIDVTTEFANGRILPLTELPEEFTILSGENSTKIIRGLQIYRDC